MRYIGKKRLTQKVSIMKIVYDVCFVIARSSMINEMTEAQKTLLLKAFDEIDTKGKGYIDRQDLEIWLMESGFVAEDAKARAVDIMECMDNDKDGKINLDDFIRQKVRSDIQNRSNNSLKRLETIDKSEITEEEKQEAQLILDEVTPDDSDNSVSVDDFFFVVKENSLSMASMNSPTRSRSRNDMVKCNLLLSKIKEEKKKSPSRKSTDNDEEKAKKEKEEVRKEEEKGEAKKEEEKAEKMEKTEKTEKAEKPRIGHQKTRSKFLKTLSNIPKYQIWNPHFRSKKSNDTKSRPIQNQVLKVEESPDILTFGPNPKKTADPGPTESWDSDTIKDILRSIEY
ncbi:hypothetical protein RFI_21097 [Reticulomyxa filosa]|uniref:EF-hand domain-containing protein n=1 Tax=Reticulomyxa filosa TaxID=46433 RepID=X6MQH3_RETFI|nr:hypothetical protein RFI_21097 [Reticulomyxa filosa]|eukprot:ETO16258.1 hypothetical protein RFI_21097 [Reticulomyxa filosa]